MSDFTQLKRVSAETKSAITRKSAQTLPNNPSERGYSAEEIKRRFYQPILDATSSALAEIDRIVDEANIALSEVNGSLNNFVSQSTIKEAYKLTLNKDTWVLNSQTNMYEVTISATTHGITNYKEVGVDMYLLDGDGNYIPVNQYEIANDATVRCFHENNGAGFLSIYVKREGFIIGNSVVDADHVIGLAKVGLTNKYEDLDGKPDLSVLNDNEEIIAKIISGGQQVNSAKNAENAENATYASTSGIADSATNAENADKAVADQYGVNISNSYCKQTGTYPNVKVGKATLADTAKADEDGLNLKANYSKQNGTYPNMKVGNATRAESAGSADSAEKATQDANGAPIHTTYAKTTGNYPNMSVGQATNATNATNASTAVNATNAQKATYDDKGRKISETYATGQVVKRNSYNMQMRVTKYEQPSASQTFDLFRDAPTSFSMKMTTIENIDGTNKEIITGTHVRQIKVGANRYDHKYLLLKIDGLDTAAYPGAIRLLSSTYQNGVIHNSADKVAIVNVSGDVFVRYNFFDDGYDFNNNAYVIIEFIN